MSAAGRGIPGWRTRRLVAALIAIALAACTGSKPSARDSAGPSASGPRPSLPDQAVDTLATGALPDISAHPVRWDAAGVAARLRSVGLLVVMRRPSPSGVNIEDARSGAHAADLVVRSSQGDSAVVAVYILGGPIVAGRWALDLRAKPGRTDRGTGSPVASALVLTNNNMVAVIRDGTPDLRQSIQSAFEVPIRRRM